MAVVTQSLGYASLLTSLQAAIRKEDLGSKGFRSLSAMSVLEPLWSYAKTLSTGLHFIDLQFCTKPEPCSSRPKPGPANWPLLQQSWHVFQLAICWSLQLLQLCGAQNHKLLLMKIINKQSIIRREKSFIRVKLRTSLEPCFPDNYQKLPQRSRVLSTVSYFVRTKNINHCHISPS